MTENEIYEKTKHFSRAKFSKYIIDHTKYRKYMAMMITLDILNFGYIPRRPVINSMISAGRELCCEYTRLGVKLFNDGFYIID